ncbi:MAG: hypothetical protein C0506_02610 [Anaerolinea sp.]|nr:hypothetical protein [Anaerolinea sp.]
MGIDWSHRLAVYTTQPRVDWTDARGFPVRALIVWDLNAGKLASSFEYSGKGVYPVGVALAGRDVFIATEKQVTFTRLDGTQPRPLLEAEGEAVVQDIAVSPDGGSVAVVVSGNDPSNLGELRVFDIGTLKESFRVRQGDGRFEGMRGHFSELHWRADGTGILVSTATHTEMWGSLATIFLDGRVRIEAVEGYGNVSPTGTMWAGNVGGVGCMFVGSHEWLIRGLDDGSVPVRGRSESLVFSPWEWSPDGTQFVFTQQEAPNCEDLSIDKQTAYVVRTQNGTSFGAPERVADLAELHRQWYGDRLFTTDCAHAIQPAVDRWGEPSLGCTGRAEPPDAPRTVRVGGQFAGMAILPQPVGVIAP